MTTAPCSDDRWSCPRCSTTVTRSGYQSRDQWDTYRTNVMAAHGAACSRKESVK